MMISAILLAAGQSKRMGKLKQLIPLGNSTIVEQSIDNLLNSRVSEVIVVLGHEAEAIAQKISNRPVKIAINPAYIQGMTTSIVAGLKLVSDKAEAVMIALADQPFIDHQVINRLIDEFDTNKRGIIIPNYQGRNGHPIIFDIKYKDEILALGSQGQLSDVVHRHSEDVLRIIVDSENILFDIDTVQDYEQARRINAC